MRARGFSLIELMIVLTIIATLAALAIPNLIRAKMAANEVASIAMIKSFGTSQELYKRTDWDGNGTLEYAQNIGPNGGNGNLESLYFNIKSNSITGLMDSAVINAEIPNTGVTTSVTPRNGYMYYVQLGTAFPTVTTYVNSKGAMTQGYSICGLPNQYSLSGVNTYQMNSTGVIFAKDQGASTLVPAYNVNPANAWAVAQ
jgi:prepilin-type N-terminal cleavage/methylation domain-containing protein